MKPSKREVRQIDFLHKRGYQVTRRVVSHNGGRWKPVYDVERPSFHNLPHVSE